MTSEGCEGCKIAKRIITEAIDTVHKEIELEIKDIKDLNKLFLKQNNVRDVPTIFFINGDIITFKYVGTMPVTVIIRWISLYLK